MLRRHFRGNYVTFSFNSIVQDILDQFFIVLQVVLFEVVASERIRQKRSDYFRWLLFLNALLDMTIDF